MRNCGTPKSNSAWNDRQADEQPPVSARATSRRHPRPLRPCAPAAAWRATALDLQHGDPDERHRGAADQHQVRRAPERHVLAEEPVPDVVEREADQREGAAGADQTRRRAARTSRGAILIAVALGLALRQDHRQEAGAEDAVEAGEDEVVRGVGQRALVAALVDVQRDVPVHAEDRDEQRSARRRRRAARTSRAGRTRARRRRRGDRDTARCRAGGPCRRRAGRSSRWRRRPWR